MSIPVLGHELDYYFTDGKFRSDRFLRELPEHKEFTLANDDNAGVYMFVTEFLDRIRVMVRRFMDSSAGMRMAAPSDPRTPSQKRFDRGRYTFVRVDVRLRMGDGSFRVRIDAANPRNVVGPTEEFSMMMAQAYADNLLELSDEFGRSGVRVELVEGENCEGIFARSRVRNERLRIIEEHGNCANRIGGQCSPSDFGCELYADGRCRYGEIMNKEVH